MVRFNDHFSRLASDYARYRPGYPPALFRYLAGVVPSTRVALDIATGNGQAAIDLAAHFGHVIASDASGRQLAQASTHPRVSYVRHAAESLPLRDGCADLVAVAQAAHWFDLPRFYAEARRVLRPGGVVALWTYSLFRADAVIDAIVGHFHAEVVGPYWPPERHYVDQHYATLPFPLREFRVPQFDIVADLGLDDVVRYLGTWSAVDRYREARNEDPLPHIAAELARAWGDSATRRITWPIHLRAGTF